MRPRKGTGQPCVDHFFCFGHFELICTSICSFFDAIGPLSDEATSLFSRIAREGPGTPGPYIATGTARVAGGRCRMREHGGWDGGGSGGVWEGVSSP